MDSVESGSVFVIRHAESEFNRKQHGVSDETRQNTEFKFNKELIDCDITEKGIQQCEQAYQQVKDETVHTVFVSPLRRALQTAHHIFRDHRDKVKFIVHPVFREIYSSNCDINGRLTESIKEFNYMDFSIFDIYSKPELHILNETTLNFIQLLQIREHAEKLSGKSFSETDSQTINEAQLLFLKNAFPTQVEDSRNIIRRAIDGKNYIHKYIQAAKPTGKVYLVGHSRYLESFIATKYENDHPVDGVFLENCQIYETKL